MTPDQTYALGLGLASLVLLVPAVRQPLLESPLVLMVGVVAAIAAFAMNKPLVAIVIVAIGLYLTQKSVIVFKTYEMMYTDRIEDDARFNPAYSVDLQVANHALPFQSPTMLRQDYDAAPLLKFPPSDATMEQMTGR